MPTLGQYLRQARTRQGLTLDDLAGRVPMSRTALHNLETGKADDPHLSVMQRLAALLGLNLGEFGADAVHVTSTARRPDPRKSSPVHTGAE